jgi:predicted  nucleic acid-binding Zn-ribbon protein
MATSKKAADTIDYSMEEKIKALYDLQKIDTKIDEINKLKGELPLEIQDLEDEVAGLQTRISNITAEIDELSQMTKQRKADIESAKALIAKYEEQLKNVRNNREYDSLNKEVEFQKLEIELSEKRIKEHNAEVKAKKALLEDAENIKTERTIDLEAKRKEMDSIEQETADEVALLQADADKARVKIDDRLLKAYNRIRGNVRNGLAVVTVKRDACGGCFNRIPPQRQYEISLNRKIIVCEYCGRILVSNNISGEEAEA